MPKTYVSNDSDTPKFIGGKLVPPGEGREFEVDDVAGSALAAVLDVTREASDTLVLLTPSESLQALIAASVKTIVATFGTMTLAQLDELEAAERAAVAPRTTLLSAIAQERLDRAQAAADAEQAKNQAQAAVQIAQQALDAEQDPELRAPLELALANAQAELDQQLELQAHEAKFFNTAE